MKLTYTDNYEKLQEKLGTLNGEWDDNQPNKKVFRLDGAVMSWFESTGTLQFQGKPKLKEHLEQKVKHLLYPTEYEESPVSTEDYSEEEKQIDSSPSKQFLSDQFEDSELIIGLVSAVGTETSRVTTPLTDRLSQFGYEVKEIKVSSLLAAPEKELPEYARIKHYMHKGDSLRESSQNNGILAYGSAKLIKEARPSTVCKTAYIINSLKHPDEVSFLRKIYGQGFYFIVRRLNYLTKDKGLKVNEANELISIDEDEKVKHGQKTRDTFHLSDFYLNLGKNNDQVKNTLERFLELIFGHPYKNPTFDEFAMYMAFSSSVRSSDLSRQVGAVIAQDNQIIATGANEVPCSKGGHYWAQLNEDTGEVYDVIGGKDYTRNEDSNKTQQNEIIENLKNSISNIEGIEESVLLEISEKLEESQIKDLTEYGRVVHAEMQAILSCAKEGISCSNATLYCTTFPCHNCAKHLIASGIMRVVYVEPYPKSKALEFHNEAISTDNKEAKEKQLVLFEPFIGVGARRFLDLFSMSSGAGNKLKRKNKDGSTVDWNKKTARIRVNLFPESYLDIEKAAIKHFDEKNN